MAKEEKQTTWSRPPTFSDQDEDVVRKVQLRADQREQAVPFAVARDCRVDTFDGRTLTAGDEVKLSDFPSKDADELREAISDGSIIEVRASDLAHRRGKAPGRDRFRTTRALMGKDGIIGPSSWVCRDDFEGQAPRAAQSAKDVRLDAMTGRVLAPYEAQPAHPGVSVDDVWQRLLSKGWIVDTHATEKARKTA